MTSALSKTTRRRLPQPAALCTAIKIEPDGAPSPWWVDSIGGMLEEFRNFNAADAERWTTVVQSAGLSN